MDETYTVFNTAEMFNVSIEAIRKWCIEFENFLSPRANPGLGKTRNLTRADLEVLALVVERRATGASYTEIHAELQNGQRGKPPEKHDKQALIIHSREQINRLVAENELLQDQLVEYRQRLEILEKNREESIRAQALLEMERARADRAEQTIQQLITERRELDREIVKLQIFLEQLRANPDQAGD